MQIISSLLFGISASLDALIMGITYGIRKIHIKLWQNLLISLVTLLGTCLSICFGRWQSALLKGLLPAFSLSIPLERFIGSMTLVLFGMYYLVKFMLSLQKKYPKTQILEEPAAPLQETCNFQKTANSPKASRPQEALSAQNIHPSKKTMNSEKNCHSQEALRSQNIRHSQRAADSQKVSGPQGIRDIQKTEHCPAFLSLKASLLLGFALSVNNMGIGLGASIAGLSLIPAAICTFLFSAVFLGLGNCLGKSHLSDLLGKAATPVSGLLLLGLGLFEWFF